MSTKGFKDSHMIATPKNSIISWLYTIIWETLTGIIGFVILVDAWSNPSPGVLLGFFLGGLFINLFLFAWVIFWEGWYNKGLSMIFNDGMTTASITKWVYWAFDQTHFLVNIIFYLSFTIFYGVFLGIKSGFTLYQPLPLVPTSMEIQNFVIFKFFAFSFIMISGFNYKFNWSTMKYVIIQMLKLHGLKMGGSTYKGRGKQ